jgi:Glycosyl transferases group 1/Glycosyl transferase 4-like domain
LRALSANHDVHLLVRSRGEDSDPEALAEQVRAKVEVFGGHLRRQGSRPTKWLSSLACGVPTWIAHQHSPALAARLREATAGVHAIVVLDDFAGTYVSSLRDTDVPVIIDKSNVMGVSLRRPSGFSELPRWLLERNLVRRFERRVIDVADAVVVTSDAEGRRLVDTYGQRPYVVVPSAVDILPRPARAARGRTIAYVGYLGYGPNHEGLKRFLFEAWPRLRNRGASLIVAGRQGPDTPALRRIAPDVEFRDYVDDLDPLFDRATIAIAPLWSGAGVKLKTLTLLGAGVPTIATPVALEGIDARDGEHCIIAQQPSDFVNAADRLFADYELRRRLAEAGRALIASRHTWDGAGQAFRRTVEAAAKQPAQRAIQ